MLLEAEETPPEPNTEQKKLKIKEKSLSKTLLIPLK